MTSDQTGEFNPLSLPSLAESVVTALMRQPVHPLPPAEPFVGSGIYAIYMVQPPEPYGRLAVYNDPSEDRYDWPVYVGKAVPKGSRKGGVEFGAGTERAIHSRLRQHGKSVAAASNLDSTDFRCRFLVTAPVWIKLAESVVINRYQPVWNAVVDGFGNHDPGQRRATQHRSKWDVLHPGRHWAEKLALPEVNQEQVEAEVRTFIQTHEPR